MVNRPTVADVARAAGVSVATVDRVVNARLPVSEDTTRRVLDAAQKLGFHATVLIRTRLRRQLPTCSIGVLLQKPIDPFYRDMAEHLETAIAGSRLIRGTPRIDFWTADDPADIADRIRKLGRWCHAVAVVSPDHAEVADAITELTSDGIPVFTLLSDCTSSPRTCFLGIDNRKVGRTAGWIIHQQADAPGKVAVIVGRRRFTGHELRELGFRSYFREHAPDFVILDAVMNSESDEATEAAVIDLVDATPDLAGIFIAGGGMAGGIAGMRRIVPSRRPAMVCPALTPEARIGLSEGLLALAICEPLDRLGEQLIELVVKVLDEPHARLPKQIILTMDLYTPENV